MIALAGTSDTPNGEFTGRRILLTGATGSIGRATARILADSGAQLVLNGRDAGKLETLAATLPANSSIRIAAFDLMNGDGIPGWMRELTENDGPFSGVAHTAGIQSIRALRVLNADFVKETFRVNTTSGIMLGKALRQTACHKDNASLVFVSSTAATIGGGGNIAYSASKAAVISMTKAMALELVRDKIRVNCIVSGLVESDMSERARKVTPPESWKVALSGYPMGIGKPEDVAYSIIYLLSDRSKWVTGIELQIDGGLSIV
jgi:NAD(P)-dependent dehydrogenase (short-subunit alcohol dehydrogenase family)